MSGNRYASRPSRRWNKSTRKRQPATGVSGPRSVAGSARRHASAAVPVSEKRGGSWLIADRCLLITQPGSQESPTMDHLHWIAHGVFLADLVIRVGLS